MYLMFVDESGTPPKSDKAQGAYLVICGIIIPEGAWHAIAKEFSEIKKKFKVRGEIKWKYFGTGNDRKDNSLNGLTRECKDDLRIELFRLIVARKAVKLICCVTAIEAAYARSTISTQNDVYHLTYKAVTERFQYFLQDAQRVTGQPQYGMVVADHRMTQDDKQLRARHHQLVDEWEPFTSNYMNFIETIFFSPSDATVGLQLADIAAGAVHRYYQYGEGRFLREIYPAFRSSPQGQVAGWGIVKMPKAGFIEPSGGGELPPPSR